MTSEDSEQLQQGLQVPFADEASSLQPQKQIQAACRGVQGGRGPWITPRFELPPRTEERSSGGHAGVSGVVPEGLDCPRCWIEGVLLTTQRLVQQKRQHLNVLHCQLRADYLEHLVEGEHPVVIEAVSFIPVKRVFFRVWTLHDGHVR